MYILPTGQPKSAPWQTLAMYNLSGLVPLVTTLITLDFDQKVPYNNHTTALGPKFTWYMKFHILFQAVGHIENHPIPTSRRGINLLQSYVRFVQLWSLIPLMTLSLGLFILRRLY